MWVKSQLVQIKLNVFYGVANIRFLLQLMILYFQNLLNSVKYTLYLL